MLMQVWDTATVAVVCLTVGLVVGGVMVGLAMYLTGDREDY